jgi:hypothetical protein
MIEQEVTAKFGDAAKQWFLKASFEGLNVYSDKQELLIGLPSDFVSVT